MHVSNSPRDARRDHGPSAPAADVEVFRMKKKKKKKKKKKPKTHYWLVCWYPFTP